MTIDEIKELLRVFNESGVGELELERADYRIRISKGSGGAATVASAPPLAVAEAPQPVPAAAASAVPKPSAPAAEAPAPVAQPDSNRSVITAPFIGTYYDQPKPGDPPYVKVGDSVEPGQVLCIIETMKLMNHIEAEIAGTVTEKLVQNGKAVEYGTPLFAIRPR